MNNPSKPAVTAHSVSALTPNARAAALSIKGIRDQLQGNLQETLFDGLAPKIDALGKTYLPALKSTLTEIVTDVRETGKGFADMLMQAAPEKLVAYLGPEDPISKAFSKG